MIELIEKSLIDKLICESYNILSKIGVFIEPSEAIELLANYGCKIDPKKHKAYFSQEVVLKALTSAPKEIKIYDRKGNISAILSGNNVHFNPGSAAIKILDYKSGKQRKPVLTDLPILGKLVGKLDHLALQSTALVPSDVPEEISDSVRLYASLKYCAKPIVTGTFRKESFHIMKDMLIAVRGNEQALLEKPLAIFDCCPSPPLRWSDLTASAVIDCARAGIPAEFVSMPLMGATAPATFIGALVQHTAENLSGVVLAQATREGAPVIYGGSPAVFDMRYGTTPMGAIETMMLDSAYAQIGKHFGLPTHAYMELSDSRWVDYQGGLESGIGAFMAALAGINMVSGAGMMDFESCQSFEKLVLDNEICGMALHMLKGINPVDDDFGFEELAKYAESGDFLKSPATRKHFRSQQYFPSKVIERSAGTMGTIESDAYKRAHQQVEALLSSESDILQSPDLQEIEQLMLKEAQKCGFNELLKNC